MRLLCAEMHFGWIRAVLERLMDKLSKNCTPLILQMFAVSS